MHKLLHCRQNDNDAVKGTLQIADHSFLTLEASAVILHRQRQTRTHCLLEIKSVQNQFSQHIKHRSR